MGFANLGKITSGRANFYEIALRALNGKPSVKIYGAYGLPLRHFGRNLLGNFGHCCEMDVSS
jgi:hypothetical protein